MVPLGIKLINSRISLNQVSISIMKNKIYYILGFLALSLSLSYTTIAQTTTQSKKFGANPTNIATSAVLEVESTDKGILFPRIALTSTIDVSTIPSPAMALTVFNTASAGTAPNSVTPGYYYWNGSKWVKMAIETPFAKTVYVDALTPVTATIFDENNPPANHDASLSADDDNLYIGSDGSTWSYNTSTSLYQTFIIPPSTSFNLANTTTDAGSNKINPIWRSGNVGIGIENPNAELDVSPVSGSSSITIGTAGTGTTDEVSVNFGTRYNDRNSPVTTGTNLGWRVGARGNAITGNSANNFSNQNAFHASYWNGTSLSNNLTILTNGNVGIKGVGNPQQALDVNGSLMFRSSGNNIMFSLGNLFQHSIRSRHSNAANGDQSNGLDFWVYRPSELNAMRVMTLQGDGLVGLGIDTPQFNLDIQSKINATATINTDAGVLRFVRPTTPNVKWGNVAQFNLGSYAINGGTAHTRLDLSMNDGLSLIPASVMTWQANGFVGIGTTTPSVHLTVGGDIAATGTVSASGTVLTSDARLKTNITPLPKAISKVMALNPVNYDKKIALDSVETVNENGFIAQELREIMPEIVSEGVDKDKLLRLNYTAIIPVLTKAMQEQQAIIQQNQATIARQQEQIDELKSLLEKLLNN